MKKKQKTYKMWAVVVFDEAISAFYDEEKEIQARAVFSDSLDASNFLETFRDKDGSYMQKAKLVKCLVTLPR